MQKETLQASYSTCSGNGNRRMCSKLAIRQIHKKRMYREVEETSDNNTQTNTAVETQNNTPAPTENNTQTPAQKKAAKFQANKVKK